jgi:hypothetical protein
MPNQLTTNTFCKIMPWVFINETTTKQTKNGTTTRTIDKSKYHEIKIKITFEKNCFYNYPKDYYAEFTTYTKKHKLGYDKDLAEFLLKMLFNYFNIHTDYQPSYKMYYNAFILGRDAMTLKHSGVGNDKKNKRTYITKLWEKSQSPSNITIEYQN